MFPLKSCVLYFVLQMLLSLFKQAGDIESVRFRSVVRLLLCSLYCYINSDCWITSLSFNRGVLQVQEDPTMSRKVAAIQ